ncbi:nuclear transport factor 2 family protein [Parvularcula sp. LCG005]|uniref:nuclear transport factor 2 family protein n=1 Tax=Parvularcula sp. LCG005 TaxID=3078805 RepID=UPI0029436469|nr:nuclear transport factor 2 family protein [Parvularcula sp. LCG005]WOI52440.1 nuclear transport factor 2 family protein [Parvularcula sp. LCG005]
MRLIPVLLSAAMLAACSDGAVEISDVEEVGAALPAADYTAREKAIVGVLNDYYASAKAADFDRWIALFAPDAIFYGTDATEAWPRDEFAAGVKESFSMGQGWDFHVRERKVTVAKDGNTAWFAELSYFQNTDYLLRPTGVMVRDASGDWKIAQLVMGVPFPNAIYEAFLSGLQATDEGASVQIAAIGGVLDTLHTAAAKGQFDEYFSLYTDDAMFLGTDATERWTMEQFRSYAKPAFADGHGWTYEVVDRHIELSPMKNVAWFDERLINDAYGETRGTGTLVRTNKGWKIAQYNLTFTIPNEVADKVVATVKGGP